jgi:hypothetical protein
MAVNRERVALVVTALRSGEYVQGKNCLHAVETGTDGIKKHTWCCLGVACDVAAKAGLEMSRVLYDGRESFDGSDGYLPESAREWFGFDSSDPYLKIPGYGACTASEVNDEGYYVDVDEDEGRTFAGFGLIARFFEDTYLKD